MTLAPRVVLVHRRTELEALTDRHGTRGQIEFFLRERGRDLAEVEASHVAQRRALAAVAATIPVDWRRGKVERADLDRFLFAPDDLIAVVGQDGLVANVAKYLDGQPVVGVDPEPGRNPGVLVRHAPEAAGDLLVALARDREPGRRGPAAPGHAGPPVERRTMVEAVTDSGQRLLALNEVYVGDPGHQSARYHLRPPGGAAERQSSSGLLAGTGTGATGWCRSVWRERRRDFALPDPLDESLAWFVREAWPSPRTGTSQTAGLLKPGDELVLVAESDHLVVFGDGIEGDALRLAWGQEVRIAVAARKLELVGGKGPPP